MASLKFTIGQLVDFDARNTPTRKSMGPYSVTRVLPSEDGVGATYRIKSVAEPFERSAKEFEIFAVGQDGR